MHQYILGMHDIIGMLLVSANIGVKIKYWILASTPISINMTIDQIIGCCFLDSMPELTPCVTCSLWTDIMSLVKQAKFAPVVGIVMTVSGRASSSFKKDLS